ncbi:MAG: phage holin family protein [Cyanobacteria bacterium]|nr:phage holin family protein [Cyanobacteria bacterium bin.51]
MTPERQKRGGSSAPSGSVGRVAAGRVTALVTSVMDLHVRIALQEADSEKRRLISGGILLGGGLTFLVLATVLGQLALVLWLHQGVGWAWIQAVLAVVAGDLVIAGLMLRIGGQLLKGPYLPQTTAGLSRTTRAIFGR